MYGKLFELYLVIVFCFLLTACGRSSEFIIINQSDSEIEIEYTTDLNLKALDDPTTVPLKMSLKDWDSWFKSLREVNWQETPQDQFSFDSVTQKCRLKLAPNEVLRLTYIDYDDFRKTEDSQRFHITNLKLTGKYGEIILNGKQMYNQFEKKDSQNYFFTYKMIDLSERK